MGFKGLVGDQGSPGDVGSTGRRGPDKTCRIGRSTRACKWTNMS